VLGALLCVAGCGVRTAVSAESDWEEATDAGPKLLACGYGPPCNPRNFGGQSCTSLGLKPGALSCDPNTCFLVLTGCGKVATGGGSGTSGAGTGSPGTPGTAAPLPMDAGALFGGLFGAQPGGGTTAMPMPGAIPGTMTGTPMTDEDGGMPAFFGAGFFGGNPGMGLFGGGLFGAQGAGTPGGTGNEDPEFDVDPGRSQ
jgi:hypothetical protein